jgi:transposase-like protein
VAFHGAGGNLAFLMMAWRLLNQSGELDEFDAPKAFRDRKLKHIMLPKSGHQRQYEETSKQAAVEFLSQSDATVEVGAAELGLDPSDLRTWQRNLNEPGKPVKTLGGLAQLRAENEALRNQITDLQVQWDVLKTTLGVLSTTVCTRETV